MKQVASRALEIAKEGAGRPKIDRSCARDVAENVFREVSCLCVLRASSGMLKVKSGNIGDEGRQEWVVL
jgi:hypothetical protein